MPKTLKSNFRLISVFLLTILFIGIEDVFAQVEVSGTVKDEAGNGIPFVRIGIIGTNVGMMSDQTGYFLLNIPEKLSSRKLTFQVPGFNTLSREVNPLSYKQVLRVQMTELSQDLGEVLVVSKKMGTKVIGNTGKRKTSEAYDYIDYPGNMAYVTKIDSKKKPYQLESINVFVGNKYQSPFFIRPMLFTVNPENGKPHKAIITKNLIFKVEEGDHWIEMNVSDLNIVVDQPVFAGVEWLSSTGAHEYFKIHANFRKGKSYMRTQISEALSSENTSTWNEYARRPMIRATISY